MFYYVFRPAPGGLKYTDWGRALGSGRREVAMIVDAHKIEKHCVLLLGDLFIQVLEVQDIDEDLPEVNYRYLPAWQDTDVVYDGAVWGPQLIQNLHDQIRE